MPILNLENPAFISVDGVGRPNAGGTVEVFVADGLFTTYATIYSDQVKTTELTNPVTLDSAGTKEIWYDVKVDIREKTSAGVLIRDTLNLDPNASQASVQGFNLAQNGSFEIDSNSDGQPDNWTISPYTGSAIAITNDVVTDGVEALEFNTTGAGTGGGTATSAKFPVTEGTICSLAFSFYATHATTTNVFQIKWYDEDDVLQSTSTVTMPASGSVPTSWTSYTEDITADAAGTQGEIVLTGISSGGSNLSSKAYFDGIKITNADLATMNTTQTLTNKTLTSPVINGSATGTAIGRGALVTKSAAQSILNGTTTIVTFDSETGGYDTDAIHDNVTNNHRLTVPTGVTKVKLTACLVWASDTDGYRQLEFSKNDDTVPLPTFALGAPIARVDASATTSTISISSETAVLDVVATDYFCVMCSQTAGAALDLDETNGAGNTYFSMEIIK